MGIKVLLVTVLALSGISIGKQSKLCHTSRCMKEAEFLRSCMKNEVNPCQDFYKYACGNFERNHPLPPGEQTWDSFDMASNATLHHLKKLLEDPVLITNSAALQKAKIMYQTCKKMDHLNGISRLRSIIEKLGGWPLMDGKYPTKSINWNMIAHTIKEFGIPIFLELSVIPDVHNGSNILKIGRAEDVGYMFNMPKHERESLSLQRWESKSTISLKGSTLALESSLLISLAMQMNSTANKVAVSEGVKAIMKLSSQLQDTSDHLMDIFETEEMTVEKLQKHTAQNYQMNWLDFLQIIFGHLGIEVTSQLRVKVSPSVRETLKIVAALSQEELANYITGRVILQLAADVNEDYRFTMLEIMGKHKMATESEVPCWRHCIARITGLGLDLPLGSNFLRRQDLIHVDYIARTLQKISLKLLIRDNWLDDNTLKLVENKILAIKLLTGFPIWALNHTLLDHYYNKLSIQPDDHIGNVVRLRSFNLDTRLSTLKNTEKNGYSVWPTTPFIANAFYQFQHNSVVLPAGIFHHPIYSGSHWRTAYKYRKRQKLSKRFKHSPQPVETPLMILDYARIGSVIGHEMTHAFDSTGHYFNEFGKIGNGWTLETENAFNFKTFCFLKQNGKVFPSFQTLDENIADSGGVRKAYYAYKKAWKQHYTNISTLPGLPNLTPDQLFFLGYATLYCQTGHNDYSTDEHGQKCYRATQPLLNMPEFSKAWGCKVVSKEKLCKLW